MATIERKRRTGKRRDRALQDGRRHDELAEMARHLKRGIPLARPFPAHLGEDREQDVRHIPSQGSEWLCRQTKGGAVDSDDALVGDQS